jgi:predicted P-loop ATPase
MKHICPPELEEYLYIGEVSTKDKDSKIEIIQNFLIIDEELESVKKQDMDGLKESC